MRFLVDAQLPPAIWQQAADKGSVVVTKDEDFAVLAHLHPPGARVVWIRYGNLRKPELIGRFSGAWPEIVDALTRGEHLIELI